MSDLAKDIWKRIAPTWHMALAGLAMGTVANQLKPGMFGSVALAVMFLLNAWSHINYVQEGE